MRPTKPSPVAILIVLAGLASPAPALAQETYVDPDLGYRITLPLDRFTVLDDAPSPAALSLIDQSGEAQLEVYGGDNIDALSLSQFQVFVASADRIAEVTYRAGGKSWFVLSGYYRREGEERTDLIFYAKFMFTPDLSRFSAFEISYPLGRKSEFDAIVSNLEKSLRAPRPARRG
jgi:hypothetical protein